MVVTAEVKKTRTEDGFKKVNEYKVLRTCGSGAYSKVKEIEKPDGSHLAMKQFFKPTLKKTITSVYDANNHI